KFSGAPEPRRSSADNRNPLAALPGSGFQDRNLVLKYVIRGMALEPPDLDRITLQVQNDTSAFTKHFGGANPRATGPQNVSAENRPRRPGQVPIRDFLNKRRNIDSGRTSLDAGSIKTKEASIGFDDCFLGRISRGDLGHIGRGGF